MRQYIQNLTDHLISKNGYNEMWGAVTSDTFLEHVKRDLEFSDVKDMKPETLGKIMCAFEIGDVMARDPGKEVGFAGDCEDLLRQLVALCLACVIRDRLNPIAADMEIPPYRRASRETAAK